MCVYLKDLFDPICNLCLFAHDCLFDRKSNQSVVCLIASSAATILAFWLRSKAGGKNRALARSQYVSPRCVEISSTPRHVLKIICVLEIPRPKPWLKLAKVWLM
jgi:hypothetical protein